MSCTTPPNDPDTPAASPIQQPLLSNPISESQAIITNVNSQIDALTKQRDYYREQVASSYDNENLERLKNRVNHLSDRLTVMGNEYKFQLTMNKTLRNDNENLLAKIKGLEEVNAECNLQAMKVEHELKIMQEDLNIALDSNMKYETRVGISELRAELQEKADLIFKLECKMDFLQRKWEALFEERERSLWDITKVKIENERLLTEVANLTAEKKVLQEQNKALEKETSALRIAKDMIPMVGGLEDYTKAIDKDWMGLIEANNKLSRDLDALEAEGVRSTKEKIRLEIQNNLLENRLKYLQHKVADYERKSE